MLRTAFLSALLGVIAVPALPFDLGLASAQPVYTPQNLPVVGPCTQRARDAWAIADRMLDDLQNPGGPNSDYDVIDDGPDNIYGTADDSIDKAESMDYELEEMMPAMHQIDELGKAAGKDGNQIITDSIYWLDHGNPEFSQQLVNVYYPLALAEQQVLVQIYSLLRAICAALHACDVPALNQALKDFADARRAYDAGC